MVVIQFGKHLFHYRFPEQNCLRAHAEAFTILSDGSHLAVIQIYHLPVAADKSFLLLLEILRIYSRCIFLSFAGHFGSVLCVSAG